MSEAEREKIEAIDERVGAISSQFGEVTDLLTALFERQLDLEEMAQKQQELLQQFSVMLTDVYGEGPSPILSEIDELQKQAKELLERTVK